MNEEVKVVFYLKKNEINDKGECPVMAQLTVGKYSETSFSAKMLAPASSWSSGRATGKSAATAEINRRLDEYRASAISIYREQSAIHENVTAEDVKCLLLGMACSQQTLLKYFRTQNKNFDKRVGVNRAAGSAKDYWYAFYYVVKFLRDKYKLSDISFSALDRSFIDKFDFYLRIDNGLSSRTIILITTRLKSVVGEAVSEGIITAFPFADYEAEPPIWVQKYLTGEELEKLMTTPLDTPARYLIRDTFLFSCYTGISYGDLCRLTYEDIEVAENGDVWIKSSRKKTDVHYEIPLLDLPLYILEKYRDIAPDGKLLPMYSPSYINEELKCIARTCGIERRLNFHLARHTFATEITLSQGVPLETVSQMLGHAQIKTTQIYAKVTDGKIDNDMKALDQRLNQRFSVVI